MRDHFDVIVLGAGPAGSSAAYILANAGLNVALVDKSCVPREKLCGGLLSGRSKKIFDEIFKCNWDEIIEYTSYGACFYNKNIF